MGRPKGVISRIADEAGLDPKTVRRALEDLGRTEQQAEANFASTVELVMTWADSERVTGHATNGRGEGGHVSELARAKAEAERHRAEKMRLQNERLRGSLVERADVEETGRRILGDLRVALLAVGARVAPRVTGCADAKTVARLIEEEIRNSLTAFADPDKFLERLDLEALE